MPNVLIDADKSVGVIDWSQAGLAHPARDLASVQTTLQINELAQHTTTFYRLYCEASGREVNDIDHKAIETYRVLAEFF
jgi:aminoglycoside phosphotransferase